MDVQDLAKLIAQQQITGFNTEYFNKVDAVYNCVIENIVMTQNRKYENKVVFELKVVENDGTDGANHPGSDCKIIYSLDPWNIEKIKLHLQGLLHVEFGSMEETVQEQLIVEALEPVEENDGKSALSGIRARVATSVRQTDARAAEGKNPFLNIHISRWDTPSSATK